MSDQAYTNKENARMAMTRAIIAFIEAYSVYDDSLPSMFDEIESSVIDAGDDTGYGVEIKIEADYAG